MTKQRTCLVCNNLFDSTGPANRRCSNCEKEVKKLSKLKAESRPIPRAKKTILEDDTRVR